MDLTGVTEDQAAEIIRGLPAITVMRAEHLCPSACGHSYGIPPEEEGQRWAWLMAAVQAHGTPCPAAAAADARELTGQPPLEGP